MAGPARTRARRDPIDKYSIAALDEEFSTQGPAARLGEFLAQQDVAYEQKHELSPEAQRLANRFDRDSQAFAKRVSIEVNAQRNLWQPVYDFDQQIPPARELLHVYGPDVQGTKGQWFYGLAWTHIDGIAGAGIGAGVDLAKGDFFGSHYTTGPQMNTYAGIGVKITPQLQWCNLSVRPYLQWSGFNALKTRVFDPDVEETRWASAMGQVGIIVQSWDLSGNAYYRDARFFKNTFLDSKPNPSETNDYTGVTGSFDGLEVDVLATRDRQYYVWICCRAWVVADPGFAKATMSSSSMSCHLPFLVIQEEPF